MLDAHIESACQGDDTLIKEEGHEMATLGRVRNCDSDDKMKIYGEERGRLVDQKASQDLLMGGIVAGVSGFAVVELLACGFAPMLTCPFGASFVLMIISGILSTGEINNQIELWDRWIKSNETNVQYASEKSWVPELNKISMLFLVFGIIYVLTMSIQWQ